MTKKKSRSEPDPLGKPPPPTCPAKGTVECYYDCLSSGFYARNSYGEFQRWGADALALKLRRAGFYPNCRNHDGLTFLESEMLSIIDERSVHYAGPLGGFQPGYYEMNASRILVTRGPKFLEPKRGTFPTLRKFLSDLLGNQGKYFCGWLKWGIDSLRAGFPWTQGQMLAIAGPPGAGKSLLQQLITPLLGGRTSSPYAYMSSKTTFNAEIFGAEHGFIGDQNHKIDNFSRRNFGSAIKNLVVEPQQYIHPKGKTPITLTPFLRLSITLNDNPQALLVLPSFDSDVAGKILLLRAREVPFPWPSVEFPDRAAYFNRLLSELPAFLWHLVRWQIPAEIADQRYGVVSFCDDTLIRDVTKLSDESKLLEILDTYIFVPGLTDIWSGTASELERTLAEKMKSTEISRLLKNASQAGIILSSLARSHPDRVTVEELRGRKTVYTILRE